MNKSHTLSFLVTLAIAVVATSGLASAAAPDVSNGVATVDGVLGEGEWNLSADFFADMYWAGKDDDNHQLISKCYLKYDGVGTLYILVLTVERSPSYFECLTTPTDGAWAKIYLPSNLNNMFLKLDGTDAANFEWVTIDGICRGYEGRLAITPGEYYINVHINVDDPQITQADSQTSKFLELQRMTLNVVPEGAMIAISASMIGAFGFFIVHKRRKP